jgi:hypothetical protein
MSNVEKTKRVWDKTFADDAPEVKDGEYDAVEPFDAVPWDAIDWASVMSDYRTLRRFNSETADTCRDRIVEQFEREFARRFNRMAQGIDKPNAQQG